MKKNIAIALILIVVFSGYLLEMFSSYCTENKPFYKAAIMGKVIDIQDLTAPDKKTGFIKLTVFNTINNDTIYYTYKKQDEAQYSPQVNDSIFKQANSFDRQMFRNGSPVFDITNSRMTCYYCR